MFSKFQNFRNEETKYLFTGASDGIRGGGERWVSLKGYSTRDSCGDGTVLYLHCGGESINWTYDEIV